VTRNHPLGISCALVGALGSLWLPAMPSPAYAQSATAREVVQPLPSPQVQRLNRALLELARSPNSVSALLEAGDASLAVDDLDAAIGFYGNAAEKDPSNPRTKLGLARVYLRSGRPVEALPLLEEAQSAGAVLRDVLGPRALAYDLVGDQVAAQAAYSQAIALSPEDDELRRRLAISQAISGNPSAFQETLAPLIEARDVAAFRARAFGLAILGEQERAEGIVNSVMPPDISARINPYLAYMPRLTPAQQAAAANLGIFPRAADIGREDPRIARFAREGGAGSRLEPQGEPLGTPTRQSIERRVVQAQQTRQTVSNTAVVETDTGPSLPQVATREVEGSGEASQDATPANVSDAFADLDTSQMPETNRQSGAVNIAELDIPREVAPEPEPAKPAHPRRIWVQLATGRDVSALGFDWRRLSRQAPELLGEFDPHVTPWGRANRLLAGPIANSRDARRLVNALSDKGIETFTYTSPEGTEIKELK
jgi:Flp pilus assembly protein TadD